MNQSEGGEGGWKRRELGIRGRGNSLPLIAKLHVSSCTCTCILTACAWQRNQCPW